MKLAELSNVNTAEKLLLSNAEFAEHQFHSSSERSYVYTIEVAGKAVLFFGASHTNDPEDEQFADLKDYFDKFKPDIVLVEGKSGIEQKANKIQQTLKVSDISYTKTKGEGTYALKLAVDQNVDFGSPEPNFLDEISMQEERYARKDIFSYYIYRMIDQYLRTKSTYSVTECKEYLQPQVDWFTLGCKWPSDEVEKYFEDIIQSLDLTNPLLYKEAVTPVPFTGKSWSIINEISNTSSQYRDIYLLRELNKILDNYNRVMVVYGSAHAVRLESALKSMMNRSVEIS